MTIAISIAINYYACRCVTYCVVSSLFSDRMCVKSQYIKSSTGIHDYTSGGLKIKYQNGVKVTRFRNPPKTQYTTSLAKKHLSKINPCKKCSK